MISEFTGTVTIINNGGANYTYEGTCTLSLTLKDPNTPGSTLERSIKVLDSICDSLFEDNQSVTITGTITGSDEEDSTQLLYTWNPNHPR